MAVFPQVENRRTEPPGASPSLIGGHIRQFMADRIGFLERQAQYGDVSGFRLGKQRAFLVNHPSHIRDLLVVSAHKFEKGRALQRAKVLLGEGLLTSEHSFHLRQRRMIQPVFHRDRIEAYSRVMVEYAEMMSGSWESGGVRDIDRDMMHLTMQVVARTLFGANVDDEADEIGEALSAVIGLFNFLLLPYSEWLSKLPIPQARRFKRASITLDRVIYRLIEERRRSNSDRDDLLSLLLAAHDEDDGTSMNDKQVRDEALTLFLAGHETTANALTWTWFLLSQHPDHSARLHDELDQVLGERAPTFADIPQLRFTEAVLAESMRLFPPAWTIGRTAIEDHEFDGFQTPKGSVVLASQWVMHRDERFWPNAGEFIPDRWTTMSVKEATQRFIYFPFGGGVRRCIGEGFAWTESVLLLATMARRWEMELVPDQAVSARPLITLRPRNGLKMRVIARQTP